jgi:hypothetical protein
MLILIMGQMHQIILKEISLTNLADRSSEEHSFESKDLQMFYTDISGKNSVALRNNLKDIEGTHSHVPPVRTSRVRVRARARVRVREKHREEEREREGERNKRDVVVVAHRLYFPI